MPRRLLIAVSPLVAIILGCSFTSYTVKQSSLVPAATAPAPVSMRGAGDVYVSNSTLAFVTPPREAKNENVGLWVPRHQPEGAISFRPREWMSFRVRGLVGLAQDAQAGHPTTLEKPDAATYVFGGGATFRILNEDAVQLTFGVDIGGASVPSRLLATSSTSSYDVWADTSTTMPGPSYEKQDRDVVMMGALQLGVHVPYEDWFRLFFVSSVQNHPTNTETFVTDKLEAEVEEGPFNLVAAIGAEFYVGEVFSVVPMVQLPVFTRPIRYGPIFSLGVRATFGYDALTDDEAAGESELYGAAY